MSAEVLVSFALESRGSSLARSRARGKKRSVKILEQQILALFQQEAQQTPIELTVHDICSMESKGEPELLVEEEAISSCFPLADVETSCEAQAKPDEIEFVEIDSDFEYYGSIYDEYEYDEADDECEEYEFCHDLADEYEAKFFGGKRKYSKDNGVLRPSSHWKQEKVNPDRYVNVHEQNKVASKEACWGDQYSIIKTKSYQRNARLMVRPPWERISASSATPAPVPAPAHNHANAVLNPNSRIEEERQLQNAIASSRFETAPCGLTYQQILELSSRDLTPEDYEMLLGLDDKVAKKTLKANEVKKFPTTVVSEPTDDVCTVCFGEQEIGQTVMILPCNHRYHVPCIETWLTKSGTTCPLCGISLQN